MARHPYFEFRQPQGYKPAPAPAKPTVLVVCLGSRERSGWPNWFLMMELISMVRDQRYTVSIQTTLDLRNFDFARNYAVSQAQKANSDFLVMFDNDIMPRVPMLNVVAEMVASNIDVCAFAYGVTLHDGLRLCTEQQGEVRGNFIEVVSAGMGAVIISKKIWSSIPAPWFTWPVGELQQPLRGEDTEFCSLVRSRGFKVFSYKIPAGHLKTADLTETLAHQMHAAVVATSGQ